MLHVIHQSLKVKYCMVSVIRDTQKINNLKTKIKSHIRYREAGRQTPQGWERDLEKEGEGRTDARGVKMIKMLQYTHANGITTPGILCSNKKKKRSACKDPSKAPFSIRWVSLRSHIYITLIIFHLHGNVGQRLMEKQDLSRKENT